MSKNYVIVLDCTLPYIGPLADATTFAHNPAMIEMLAREHRIAQSPCLECGQAIGYEEDFYQGMNPRDTERLVGFLHERCKPKEQLE